MVYLLWWIYRKVRGIMEEYLLNEFIEIQDLLEDDISFNEFVSQIREE